MKPARMKNRFLSLWGWPIVLGLLTAIGLVSALFSDGGFGDQLSGVCLGIVTAVGLWFSFRR
ncbi:hypothetical protein HUK68_21860 (plasmid) [Comamonas antarctica]|uniref:Uncharacterized protein n=2 Tax=Comamonas antarctica TaxID=2743470 RepID=A0A6N1X858_9BURK|nr:hypothetical protein [Comamonas antarctica]QKV55559.1 hypothetical protein HUK68_21860 [Comamonas antarctica]